MRKDFIKYYKALDKFDKADVQEKVMLHQGQRMKKLLKEFFRLLDTAITSNKLLPIEAFAQHLGLTFDELVEQLDRLNWDDRERKKEEEEADNAKLKPPIHIEQDFYKYYHQVDTLDKKEIIRRISQTGIPAEHKEKLLALFTWLSQNEFDELVSFDDLVKAAGLHPQELIRYLDRINWS